MRNFDVLKINLQKSDQFNASIKQLKIYLLSPCCVLTNVSVDFFDL
uniref:Uncharacterized protein n=1 Tax=Meloidogyne enterolobii TaxID=390850 RepID=A0A6V7W9M9_MELEN|nr:unnamed protein product [Meloidogyne enterolobii]